MFFFSLVASHKSAYAISMSNLYIMPAEWSPHAATWLAWPHYKPDWPGRFDQIPPVYAEMVRLLSEVEPVHILVQNVAAKTAVRHLLQRAGANLANVRLYAIRTDRSWIRDYGPIFVHDRNGHVAANDFVFNGWAKYKNWQHDNAVPQALAKLLRKDDIETDIVNYQNEQTGEVQGVVLEGGSIDVNGNGLLLATEECLLSREVQARNPRITREEIEEVLLESLGCCSVVWLNRGLAGDTDTHGHIDNMARFVSQDTVVCCSEPDPNDPNFEPLAENLERLRAYQDHLSKRLQIALLPLPRPIVYDGVRLPASYANFYIANDLVLVPTFNDEADRLAVGMLSDLFPDRRVVGVYSRDLVWGKGALHCSTLQQPRNK